MSQRAKVSTDTQQNQPVAIKTEPPTVDELGLSGSEPSLSKTINISAISPDSDTHEFCIAICTSSSSRFRFYEASRYAWFRRQVLQRELGLRSQAAVEAAVNNDSYLMAYSVIRNFEQLPLDGCRDYDNMWEAVIDTEHKWVYIVVEKIMVRLTFLRFL